MKRKEARLLQTRCRNGRGRNLTRLFEYLVCGLVGVSGICWMKQSIKYNSVSREGKIAVVAVETVGHDGMSCSVWLDHGREEVPTTDWLNASVVAPTVCVTPPLEESSSCFFGVFALGLRSSVEVFADVGGTQAPVSFFSLLNAVAVVGAELVRKTEAWRGPAAVGRREKRREKGEHKGDCCGR